MVLSVINTLDIMTLLVAEAITTSGQLSIRWIERALNKYLNNLLGTDKHDYVLASDTDSVYITFDKLVNKVFGEQPDTTKVINFLDTIATDKIEPFIDKSYQELAGYVNAYSNKMSMKREVIADKGIWTAKKRYILKCIMTKVCDIKNHNSKSWVSRQSSHQHLLHADRRLKMHSRLSCLVMRNN